MAATNVYASIRAVPFTNTPPKKLDFDNIQATPADFWLDGGYYGVDCVGATFGTVTLSKRGPDDSTYLTVGTSTTFAANGATVVLLGPGHYRLTIA